jgi:hypothetical protein
MATKTTAPLFETFPIDIPDDVKNGDALDVSHAVTFGNVTVRVLKEPHQYNILKGAQDPLSAIQAFVHPDDWTAFDRWMAQRRQLDGDTLGKIFNALVEKPTGHPTPASPDSSDI